MAKEVFDPREGMVYEVRSVLRTFNALLSEYYGVNDKSGDVKKYFLNLLAAWRKNRQNHPDLTVIDSSPAGIALDVKVSLSQLYGKTIRIVESADHRTLYLVNPENLGEYRKLLKLDRQ